MRRLKVIKVKKYFSDRKEILKSILKKNKKLFWDLRLNINKEKSDNLKNINLTKQELILEK